LHDAALSLRPGAVASRRQAAPEAGSEGLKHAASAPRQVRRVARGLCAVGKRLGAKAAHALGADAGAKGAPVRTEVPELEFVVAAHEGFRTEGGGDLVRERLAPVVPA